MNTEPTGTKSLSWLKEDVIIGQKWFGFSNSLIIVNMVQL